jgi:hypothetical protein
MVAFGLGLLGALPSLVAFGLGLLGALQSLVALGFGSDVPETAGPGRRELPDKLAMLQPASCVEPVQVIRSVSAHL